MANLQRLTKPKGDTERSASGPDEGERVRRLRSEPRRPVSIRAFLKANGVSRQVEICDLSRAGAGFRDAFGLLAGDAVTIELLNGRTIEARVRWSVGGRCGVAFDSPLAAHDGLVHGRRASRASGDKEAAALAADCGHRIMIEDPAASHASLSERVATAVEGWVAAARERLSEQTSQPTTGTAVATVDRPSRMTERACREQGFAWLTEDDGDRR